MGVSKMKKYTILIDLDDTMIDLLGCWVPEINKRYGTNVNPEKINDWNISQFFPTLSREQVFEPLFENDFWNNMKPKTGAIKYIKALKDDGHKVYICTNSNYKTIKNKMDAVLFKFFDYISWNDVIVTTHKQIISADFLIDDGVHNLVGGKYKGILMDAPHNRSFDEKEHNIVRFKSWKEIYGFINDMAG